MDDVETGDGDGLWSVWKTEWSVVDSVVHWLWSGGTGGWTDTCGMLVAMELALWDGLVMQWRWDEMVCGGDGVDWC